MDHDIFLRRADPNRARRVGYEQITHGVHAHRGGSGELALRCQATQLILPRDSVFSHYTSAALRGWQLPWLPAWLPDFASVPGGGTYVRRRGLYVARTDEATTGFEVLKGVRVAPACATLAQMAQDLSLIDLVATIDSALHRRDCTEAELADSIRPHQRGGAKLRRALAYVDGRAESWWETPLRLLHVWCDVDVRPQYDVFDDRGNFVARGDLWIVGTRRLHEYDGAYHDESETRPRDLGRDKALNRIRWERYGYVARDLVRHPRGILADADAALSRPHRPDRLKRWRAEAARSTLSAAGRSALAGRLRRFARP